jgi:heptaprenyl diphosphate synthase
VTAISHQNGEALDIDAALEALATHGIRITGILDQAERRLREQVRTSHVFVEQAARYLMDAGGKRFRPLLLALTGQLGPVRDERLIADAAVVVELVHLATLHHDDVIDQAVARRGTASPNLRWNNTVAVLTGDYLFARASELAADLGVDVTRIMASTISSLCEGQIREIQGSRAALPPDLPAVIADHNHYLSVIADKTASLIATSCGLGAMLSACRKSEVEQLTSYGLNLGMAFQLIDDILDITSEQAQSGKMPGTDLREGVRTLPVLYALEAEPDGELAVLLDQNALNEACVERALALLRRSDALERARTVAFEYARGATACLEGFADGPVIRALQHVSAFAVARTG